MQLNKLEERHLCQLLSIHTLLLCVEKGYQITNVMFLRLNQPYYQTHKARRPLVPGHCHHQ